MLDGVSSTATVNAPVAASARVSAAAAPPATSTMLPAAAVPVSVTDEAQRKAGTEATTGAGGAEVSSVV